MNAIVTLSNEYQPKDSYAGWLAVSVKSYQTMKAGQQVLRFKLVDSLGNRIGTVRFHTREGALAWLDKATDVYPGLIRRKM